MPTPRKAPPKAHRPETAYWNFGAERKPGKSYPKAQVPEDCQHKNCPYPGPACDICDGTQPDVVYEECLKFSYEAGVADEGREFCFRLQGRYIQPQCSNCPFVQGFDLPSKEERA